jgi:hypothetical protein
VKKHSKTQALTSAAKTKAKTGYSRKNHPHNSTKNRDSSKKKHPLPTQNTELQQHKKTTPPPIF